MKLTISNNLILTGLVSCSSCKSHVYDQTSGCLPPAAAGAAAHSERMRSEEPGSGLHSGAEQLRRFVVFFRETAG